MLAQCGHGRLRDKDGIGDQSGAAAPAFDSRLPEDGAIQRERLVEEIRPLEHAPK